MAIMKYTILIFIGIIVSLIGIGEAFLPRNYHGQVRITSISTSKKMSALQTFGFNPFRSIGNLFKEKETVQKVNTINTKIVIIGAGASGLACGLELAAKGENDFIIIEGSDEVGGRIRTDVVDGYLLDRGFQVFIEGYPEANRLLDYEKLELCQFLPGAFVRYQNALHLVSDPLRHPEDLIPSLISPIGSLFDKMKVGLYSITIPMKSIEDIWKEEETSTETYLRDKLGVSSEMIDRFFTPFYQGIFLAPLSLQSSRMFEFVFQMFSISSASLPKNGMGQITAQLASSLPKDVLRLNTRAVSLSDSTVSCETLQLQLQQPNESKNTKEVILSPKDTITKINFNCERIVIAVDPLSVQPLLQSYSTRSESIVTDEKKIKDNVESKVEVEAELQVTIPERRSSICVYYGFDGEAPISDPLLILNGDKNNKIPLDWMTEEMEGKVGEATSTSSTTSSSSSGDRVVVNNVCFPSQ
eukprot:gene7836-16027_t